MSADTRTGTADHGATWALVEAAQAGNAEAFGQLYDQYVDSVFRYVLFRVGDRNLAEDVTSETFERALRYRESFDPRRGDGARCVRDRLPDWGRAYAKMTAALEHLDD